MATCTSMAANCGGLNVVASLYYQHDALSGHALTHLLAGGWSWAPTSLAVASEQCEMSKKRVQGLAAFQHHDCCCVGWVDIKYGIEQSKTTDIPIHPFSLIGCQGCVKDTPSFRR